MDLQISGKRALVTGSSQGMGAAIARALAGEGATVILHGRNEDRANRVANEITVAGGRAFVALGDLATDKGGREVCDFAMECAGGIDILINNVGAIRRRGWMDACPSDWADSYNTNVLSAVRMIRGLVPQMKRLKWGRIIQVGSSLATKPLAVMPDYSAAKAALLNMTLSLALELAETGITVNAVTAGLIETTASKQGSQGPQQDSKRKLQVFIPLGRPGRVEEVVNLVVFLSSPLAGYIHGANLVLDGGYVGPVC